MLDKECMVLPRSSISAQDWMAEFVEQILGGAKEEEKKKKKILPEDVSTKLCQLCMVSRNVT